MERTSTILRVLMVVLVIGLVVMAGAFVRLIVTGGQPDTPRTELERAVFAAEEAVKANPEDPNARLKLAAAYMEQDSYGLAEEQAEIALRLNPSEAGAFYVIGLSQFKQDNNKEAIENLTKAIDAEGQVAQFYQDAYVALARAQEADGDQEAALASLDRAIDFGPENALILYERGQMYERQENFTYAAMDYGWALSYVPSYQPARDAFARIQEEHPDDWEEAVDLLESTASPSDGAPQPEDANQ
jgi:tetratricopeptide (TPR) repeat protein